MDIQELKIDEISTDSINVVESSNSGGKKSVNFGPGADLLMNHNRKEKDKTKISSGIDDLDSIKLDIDSTLGNDNKKSIKEARNSLFSGIEISEAPPLESTNNIKLDINDTIKLPSVDKPNGILKGAIDKNEKTKTKDGFKKFNDIPINPDIVPPPKEKKLTGQELLKEKFKYLRLLESIEKKGATLSKKYSMDSNLLEMKGEYETLMAEKEKSNSIKFQGKMLMAFVSGLEFLNNRFDPFDIKLDGWAESVNENLDEYDEVFGELHEKYGSKTKMAPELKLLFMLGGSGVMLHMTNTMFKSAMPGMDDIMRQNPELMQQFTAAAANSMGASNPGLGNFMNMMGGMQQQAPPMQAQPPMGSPPGPTEDMRRNPPQMNTSRPDISMARNNSRATFNDAENMESNFASVNEKRKEMRGPNDIRDILSGLKTKKINLSNKDEQKSTISIDDMNELNNAKLNRPRKSRRKPKSERNTISLDL
tara:strand:+ start:26685 stop:28118 length:1434 start_codon:yes stop_codon:yes gene_type:complete